MKKRLSKYLAETGLASRRKCEDVIFCGRVKVNGNVTLLPQALVDENDTILIDDQPIRSKEKKVYLLLNKPMGYVCSPIRKKNYDHVLDIFSELNLRLFTVGRLDKDTTGLLLITNDGHFAQSVIHPSSGLEKEYIVKTKHDITQRHISIIRRGTEVENTFVKPKRVKKLGSRKMSITVCEGKKREVRVLVACTGQKIESLCRIRIGGLTLKHLPIGSWRKLSENDKERLFAV